MTKDTFRPCRLLLADGQEIHVLGHNDYGLSPESTLLMLVPGLIRTRVEICALRGRKPCQSCGSAPSGAQIPLLVRISLKQIKPAEVERVEPLPYRVIDEDRSDIAKARKALAEIRRRDLIPQAEGVRLLGLVEPKGGGK